MRHARDRIPLVVAAAIAATAVVAPTASATDTVEVVNEHTATHCATTGANVCTVHASGLATLRLDLGVFGEAFEATCNLEVAMRVGETGSGFIDQVSTGTGLGQEAGCPTVTTECGMPWAASGEEDGPTGVVQSVAGVCIDPAESGTNCAGNLPFEIVEQSPEYYVVSLTNAVVDLCELDADLEIEDDYMDPTTGRFKYAELHVNHP